ncbi:hypothetical protein CVT25_004087 [Psilocybe cyanescens]|uniref:Uncharacterized protein n=1 Tax=Psilocybe cyanescens TaxID=93625 RepID=A0A409X8Z3_PSICY|nr:hypothetical protein CVT25_004087 [Psilocybe cyanescens]
MEPHLAKLLHSNEDPSKRTIFEIKEILQEPSRVLLANELELQRLEQAILALKKDQERIHDFIKPYNTILAPIRRMPADILHEIFYHCLSSHRFPIMDASEAPLLLTHICSSWRSIALSSPRLWAKVVISLLTPPHTDPTSLNSTEELLIQKYERAVALRSEVIETWLDRSGDCPLSISIMCPYSVNGGGDEWMTRMLDSIVSCAQRWHSAELVVPYLIYSKIEASISEKVERLPVLRRFKLKLQVPFNIRTPVRSQSESGTLIFLNSPKLDTLSLSWKRFTRNFRDMPPVWNQLRRLYLHSELPPTHLIPLLSQCPKLVECRLWISSDDYGNVHQTAPRTGRVSLPHLQSFIVHDTSISLATVTTFRVIDAPSLSRVGYTRSFSGSSGWDDNTTEILNTQLSSVCDLLGAGPVDKLMLALAYTPSETVVNILKKVSSPKHVILGQKPLPFRQAESTGSPRYMDTMYHQTLPGLNQFDLSNLIITDFSSSESIAEQVNILPNLEILEVYGISHFSDDDALELIKSRLDASKAGRVAGLKTVTFHFDRRIERDIKEEIDRYARAVSASPVELKLVYEMADDQPTHMKHGSSSYGLSGEGLSWASSVEYDEFQ